MNEIMQVDKFQTGNLRGSDHKHMKGNAWSLDLLGGNLCMQPSQGYIYEQCLPQGPQEMDPGVPIPLHGSPILFHTNEGKEDWGRCHAPNTFGTVNMEHTINSSLSWSKR